MKQKELVLKFNLDDWLDRSKIGNRMLNIIPHMDTDVEQMLKRDHSEGFKKKFLLENKERAIARDFIKSINDKYKENRELILAHQWSQDKPVALPELIEFPKTKILYDTILINIKKVGNEDIYYKLLENNNIFNYHEKLKTIRSESRRDNNVTMYYDVHNGEDNYMGIFLSAIAMCPPAEVQSEMEYLATEYKKILKIDSKKKVEEKEEEFRYNFHKSLRQTDPLGNPHAESILWNLLQFTDIPHRAIKAVLDYEIKFKSK